MAHPVYHGGRNHPEQVSDEFLTCRICNVPGFKYPRILPCGHTFCSPCLEGYLQGAETSQTFPCPTCRLPNILPGGTIGGLNRNLYQENQIDRLRRRHNNAKGPFQGPKPSFYTIYNY